MWKPAVAVLGAAVLTVSVHAQSTKNGDPKAQQLEAKLSRIVIPHIEFEDAGLRDAINTVHRRSMELDPDGEGVNFVVHVEGDERKVALELNNVSIKSVLRAITLLTDTESEIEENIVIIRSKASAAPKDPKPEPPAGRGP